MVLVESWILPWSSVGGVGVSGEGGCAVISRGRKVVIGFWFLGGGRSGFTGRAAGVNGVFPNLVDFNGRNSGGGTLGLKVGYGRGLSLRRGLRMAPFRGVGKDLGGWLTTIFGLWDDWR